MAMSASSSMAYRACASSYNETKHVLECVSSAVEEQQAAAASTTLSWLLVLAGSLVFFMQAGFAMLCAGCVRKKNVQNTMLKNLLDATGAAVAFYIVGYAIAFGGQNDTADITFMGNKNFLSLGHDVDQGFWFYEYAFSAASVTIVAGTLAERCQMAAYLCYSLFLTGFVYPVVAHAIWSNNGFLSAFSATPLGGIGAVDFAGSGVVHLTGGTTALMATIVLGARKGRFHDVRTGKLLDEPRDIPGHSMALQLLGTMVLWFGWYGFNPGSALLLTNNAASAGEVGALAAVNTTLAAAVGGISALVSNLWIQERKTGEYFFDLTMAMNGALSGLVAITAACGTVENWAAIVIAIIAGWIYIGGSKLLLVLKLDDAVDAIPVHMFNGAWGLIATGLFSSSRKMYDAFGTDERVGWFYSWGRGSADATLLKNNVLAMLFVFSWSVAVMLPFFVWLNYMGWFRADALEELVGLDMSYHGGQRAIAQQQEEVKEEQITEFQRQRSEQMRRRRDSRTDAGSMGAAAASAASAAAASAPVRNKAKSRPSTTSHSGGGGVGSGTDDAASWTDMTYDENMTAGKNSNRRDEEEDLGGHEDGSSIESK